MVPCQFYEEKNVSTKTMSPLKDFRKHFKNYFEIFQQYSIYNKTW